MGSNAEKINVSPIIFTQLLPYNEKLRSGYASDILPRAYLEPS